MDKHAIIEAAIELLSEANRNGTISLKGVTKTVPDYIREDFSVLVTDKMTPEYVAQTFETKFDRFIIKGKTIEEKRAYIQIFIDETNGYEATIKISETDELDVTENLLSKAEFMDDDFNIQVGPNKRTLQEYYEIIIRNKYQSLTLVDKAEICEALTRDIEIEILESPMQGYDGTVQEYITEVLPTMMTSCDQIEFHGNTMLITDVIERIKETQKEMIDRETAKKFGNPDAVGELIIQPDGKVISDAPVKPLVDLSQEEYTYLAGQTVSKVNEQDDLSRTINYLMDYISKVTDEHDLSNVEKEVNELPQTIESTYINAKLDKLRSMITMKRNNIIKVEGNKEYFGDAIVGKIRALESDLRNNPDPENYNRVIGEITAMEMSLEEKGITDYQIKAELIRFKESIMFKRMKEDLLTKNQSKDKERLKEQIDAYILGIKQEVYAAQSETRQAYVTGIQIRVDNAYAQVNSFVIDAFNSGMLTKEEKEYYLSEMDFIVGELDKEKQVAEPTTRLL